MPTPPRTSPYDVGVSSAYLIASSDNLT